MARNVGRAGAKDVAAAGRRRIDWDVRRPPAAAGHPGHGNGPPRRRTDRTTAASGLAVCQGRTSRVIRPADPGVGSRLGSQRDPRVAGRRGPGGFGAHRKLRARRQPAPACRKPTERTAGATDSTGPQSDNRSRRRAGVHRGRRGAAAARRCDRDTHPRGHPRGRPTDRGRRPRGRRIDADR